MTLRAAVIGCGFIGAGPVAAGSGIQSHAAAWAAHPGARLAGLVDPDPKRLAAAAARWPEAGLFTEVGEMLERVQPALVSVATPDETHARILDRVLDADCVRAVLAEKPLALDAAEAAALVARAGERGVVLAVNHVRRFAPSHRLLANWLSGAPIGPIELVRGSYVRGIKHNGTHWLDLARWLVGDITAIRGRGESGSGEDATIDAELDFACGARGSLHGIRQAPYSFFEMDLIGRQGRVRISDGGARFEHWRTAPSRRFPGFSELEPAACPTGGLADLLMHAVSDLIEALTTGRAPAATGPDAVVALRLAEEALTSARGDHAFAGR